MIEKIGGNIRSTFFRTMEGILSSPIDLSIFEVVNVAW